MDTKQPEALRIANTALQVRNKDTPDDVYVALVDCAWALRNLHAENERLRAGYDATRHEIANLQERAQELGKAARDVNSRRVQELEAQLAAVGAGGVEPLRKRECLHQITEPDHFRGATKLIAAARQAGEQNNLPLAITSAPERIWLDLGFNPYEDDVHFSHLHDLTWSQNNATGDGIEYVRADRAARGAAQAAPVDAERLDYLQECGVTVEVLPGRPGWTFRIGGLHGTVHRSVRTAIDAARAAQGGA